MNNYVLSVKFDFNCDLNYDFNCDLNFLQFASVNYVVLSIKCNL